MKLEERIARASEDAVYREIVSISKVIGVESNQDVIESAIKIAKSFLKANKLIEPITLARASFYIAAKEQQELTKEKIRSLIHNNGTTNRWWMYLVPLVERNLKRR